MVFVSIGSGDLRPIEEFSIGRAEGRLLCVLNMMRQLLEAH